MATATNRTKAKARQTRAEASRTRTQARQTGRQAERTVEQAGRTVRTMVEDTAYATVGLGDAAVGAVKSLPETASEAPVRILALPMRAPEVAKTLRTEVVATARRFRGEAQGRFDELAARGRERVESIRSERKVRESIDRSRTARRQVKAAATSVSRAATTGVEAGVQAVEQLGGEPRERYEDMTLEELRELAGQRDIEGRSTMNKDQLVRALTRTS
jgi:hypothetical protein